MQAVKTFTSQLNIFNIMKELEDLDKEVNRFIEDNAIAKVIGVSDTATHGDGNAIGIIRVLTYEK